MINLNFLNQILLFSILNQGKVRGTCPCTICGKRTICSKSQFAEVPFGIPNLVEQLLLPQNRITTIRYFDFNAFHNLTELYLDYNRLKTLETKCFVSLTKLQKLHLEHNQLTEISKGIFDTMKSLTHLTLDNNKLLAIPPDIPFMKTLNYVSLSSNQISMIPWSSFSFLTSLTKIFVFDNPFVCDCDNNELHLWFQEFGTSFGAYNIRAFESICSSDQISNCTAPQIISSGMERKKSIDKRYPNTYNMGGMAYLKCVMKGNPSPLAKWRTPSGREITVFDNDEKYKVWKNGTIRMVRYRLFDAVTVNNLKKLTVLGADF